MADVETIPRSKKCFQMFPAKSLTFDIFPKRSGKQQDMRSLLQNPPGDSIAIAIPLP